MNKHNILHNIKRIKESQEKKNSKTDHMYHRYGTTPAPQKTTNKHTKRQTTTNTIKINLLPDF